MNLTLIFNIFLLLISDRLTIVSTERVFLRLRKLRIHPKLKSLIRLSLTNSTAMVKIPNSNSHLFKIRKGSRPIVNLLKLCLEYVMRKIKVNPQAETSIESNNQILSYRTSWIYFFWSGWINWWFSLKKKNF